MKKYIYISNDIRNKILKGEYKANEQIPFERELCESYEASKMTIKKALDILVAEGLIIKRRGAGTTVKDLSMEEMEKISMANQFRGLTGQYPDKKIKSEVLDFRVIEAPKNILNKLNISGNSFVYDIYRLRKVNGEPMVLEKTYMPIDLIPGLSRAILEDSIYEYIEEDLGLKIQSSHRNITVRRATDKEADLLKLEKGDPVAVAEQIAYFDTGTAFEFSTSVHRYDKFQVELVLTRS